jgi:hypothetical protein
MSYHVVSCHVVSRRISCHIMSYHVSLDFSDIHSIKSGGGGYQIYFLIRRPSATASLSGRRQKYDNYLPNYIYILAPI